MKQMLSILCAAVLVLSLAACGGKEDPSSRPESGPSPAAGVIPEPGEGSSQPFREEESALYFSLGPGGEAKAIRPGDTLGGWTLQSWNVNWGEETDGAPWVDGAVFTAPAGAPVELSCTVYLSPMASEERTYWFDVAEEDCDKMPMIEGATAKPSFRALDNAALAALEAMGPEDRWDCRVAVSRYVYYYLPRAVTDGADVVRLEVGSADARPGESGDRVIEDLSREEQQTYYKKYIEPYDIVGLLYSTWSDPEEIEVQRYMRFYICNESDNYWSENPVTDGYAIPWYTVEDFIASYFEVSPGYLRSAENYDPTTACYRGMRTEGIGGGPDVTIERIEKDGDLWKFVCRDEGGNQLSVTIRVYSEYFWHYVAGEGLDL